MLFNKQWGLIQLIIFIAFVAMTLPYPMIAPLLLKNTHVTFIPFIHFPLSNKALTSLVFGAYPLGLFLGGYVLSHISDRISKKYLIAIGIGLASMTQVFSGILVFHQAYSWLLVSRLFSGFFEGHIVVARAALAIVCRTEQIKIKQFGRLNASLTLGWAVGPLLGALLSQFYVHSAFHASFSFFTSSIINVFCLILVLCYFTEPSSSSNKEKKDSSTKKNVLLLAMAAFPITLGIDCFYQFMPIYITLHFQFNVFLVGLTVSIVALFNALTNIYITPFLGKRMGVKSVVYYFSSLLSFMLLLFAFVNNRYWLYVVSSMIGLSIAICMTNITVLLSSRVSDKKQGKLMGFLLCQRTLGTALVSVVMIPLLHLNYRLPFIIGFVLIALGAILLRKLR